MLSLLLGAVVLGSNGLIGFLVTVLIAAVVAWIVTYIIRQMGAPAFWVKVVWVIFALLVLLAFLDVVGLFGGTVVVND